MSEAHEKAKQAVLDTWGERLSGSLGDEGAPGTPGYIEALLQRSRAYAPWKDEAIGLADAAGRDLLDVGCGQGVELVEFARAGARVTGVDLVPAHVEQARANLAALSLEGTVETGDAERLELPDRSFDLAISNNALQFTPDLDRALAEIFRVLRPRGELRLILYHRDSVYYWLHFFLGRGVLGGELRGRSMPEVVARNIPWSEEESPPNVHLHSRRGLRARLRRAGFADLSTQVYGFHPEHSALTARLAARVPSLRDGRLARMLGRAAGWYIVGRGRRPG